MTHALRIAILTHSTNPRGGVVHALELGDALSRLGHEPTVFAPDVSGAGFFRDTRCRTVCVAASPVGRDVRAMVETRVADYLRYFAGAEHRGFDVWHAQDGISGNALATLKGRGLISGFARTVHHVETFDDQRLCALQARSIEAADHLFVVGRVWRDWLAREFGRDARLVGNGVDRSRYSPTPDETDGAIAQTPRPAGRRAHISRGRRDRGTQKYDTSSAGVPNSAAAASLCPAGDRGRRFAPRPRRLSSPFRRGARA